MSKIITGLIKWVLIPVVILILVGYVGQWYGQNNECTKCQIGFPNFFNIEDTNKTILCWMPSHCPVKSE